MPETYLNVTPLDAARRSYLEFIEKNGALLSSVIVPITEACTKILASAVYAKISAPHYYASAMDGYAIHASDAFGASETTPITLKDAVPLDTGDPVPDGYDCVVMIEDVVERDGVLSLFTPCVPWQNIRQIGEDITQGEMAFPAYTKLTPTAIGALVACGVREVEVLATPLVGIIPTGDEVVAPTDHPAKGDVLEFNSLIFTGMFVEWGASAKTYPIVADDIDKIKEAVSLAASECDVVLLMAGSSKGRGDFASDVISELGEIHLHGVAIRPGKPAILGRVGKTPIIGVPGYPISGVIVMKELIGPVLEHLTHNFIPQNPKVTAELSTKIVSPLQYEEFIRCRLARIDNRLIATPILAGASLVTSFAKSDGIIHVPQNAELLSEGSSVEVELSQDMRVIENTISVVGSHDPLFDELNDVLALNAHNIRLSSSHVGSMGAINAVTRSVAHAGGIHLLDQETGEYNIPYLRRYFPQGGVRLMRGVGRTQGIMAAKGNPLAIRSVSDFADGSLRYVNRQRGAGTRILLDYLLEQSHVDPEGISGYSREEMTHLAVAVQIASGGADAGLGIYAAAKAFDLDFIPVYTEHYDILLSESFYSGPLFELFAEAFCSEEMRTRLAALGGYTVDGIGEMIDLS